MTNFNLEKYTLQELKDMCKKLFLKPGKTKIECIKDITIGLEKYEKNKDKYKKGDKLGFGKEGVVYLVTDRKGKKYVMKTFKKTKSSKKILNEISLQKKLESKKICPKIVDYNLDEKYIIMEKMDSHLLDSINKFGLSKSQQLRLLYIFEILDKYKVFHDDANLSNYMFKNDEIYIIDFGYAKQIDEKLIKKLGTNTPNYTLMTVGFILKLKEAKILKSSYRYLINSLDEKSRHMYGLL
jgi:serine/threonine protein kinase